MVINREFFFRGWLPAGLLINAKMVTKARSASGPAVLKPVLNPLPGSGWSVDQPRPVFPVEQASDDSAIVLADPLPDGTLALLPLGDWYGSGTPYLLGVNTWYEGRIRVVSGDDVMSVRLLASSRPNYFSDNDEEKVTSADVAAVVMPCRHIIGRYTEQILVLDKMGATTEMVGWSPTVSVGGSDVNARVMNKVPLSGVSFAGTRTIYNALGLDGQPIPFIQCTVVDGSLIGSQPAYVGIALRLDSGDQKFFYVGREGIMSPVEDLIKTFHSLGVDSICTVAVSNPTDQVVHYN